MEFCPPVVFLIFNRPDLTEMVFAEIRRARPRVFLIVADGPCPERPDDEVKCTAVRSVIKRVDWPCEVLTNYSETNLGCKQRVSTGLSWAFEQVEEAIVLEDDCLPHSSFFRYCAELLERYRHDTRVMSVSGDNYQQGHWRGTASYYFSKYGTCWGWASWRRAWRLFDLSMSLWPTFRQSGGLRSVCPDFAESGYWHAIFESMHDGMVNSWAYAWVFAHFAHSGLSPHPNRNLISNIGCRADGTHTTLAGPLSNLPIEDIGAIIHPDIMVADREADLLEFDDCHGGRYIRDAQARPWPVRSLSRVKRIALSSLKRVFGWH